MSIQSQGIYDARSLGRPKFFVLGIQHLFAMFGATVLVPLITGLDVSATLLFAGIGTLIFHFVSQFKVPAFLGSSFAFLGGYASVKQLGMAQGLTEEVALNYACIGVATAAIMYFIMAFLLKMFGTEKVMRFFPPIVTGPMVIAIGLTLSGSAINNCSQNWFLAWIGMPLSMDRTAFAVFQSPDYDLIITSIIAIFPIAFATIMEHIGDMCAIQSTVNRNFIKDPGLHRTLCGDGLATFLASFFGAPANTTYGENTGVLNLTKVFDPRVIRLAAVFAILLSFCPKFACLIGLMPAATIGGVSLILYGMISAVGVRNLVETSVDFSSSRNVFVAALILVISIGVQYSEQGGVSIGPITISGLALAAIVGIFLNAILPEKLGMKVKSFNGKEKPKIKE